MNPTRECFLAAEPNNLEPALAGHLPVIPCSPAEKTFHCAPLAQCAGVMETGVWCWRDKGNGAIETLWLVARLAGPVATGLIALIVLSARSADPEQKARRMQTQIAQVRGLQFKRDVVIHEQSRDEFRKTAEGLLRELSTPEQAQVLRTLGLLASDETLDADGVLKQVEGDGPLGAYDPSSDRMLVVKAPNPRQHTQRLDDLYAREFLSRLAGSAFRSRDLPGPAPAGHCSAIRYC